MAYRYRREGEYFKHRVTAQKAGYRPWIDDFRWRAVSWHYNFTMGPEAEEVLKSNDIAAEPIQYLYNTISHGESVQKYPYRTKHFFMRTFIPQIVPNLKTSNPFCTVTPNKTGWKEYTVRIRKDPVPMGHKHVVAGTDPTPPVMPPKL
eukprot:GHVL01037960.1.p1 GENE.GHVL01037960.1~~GHVL01037960.1.p1  ORF type:complete len:148 (-),score=25.95 GHVL01037960.1:84-527(-)